MIIKNVDREKSKILINSFKINYLNQIKHITGNKHFNNTTPGTDINFFRKQLRFTKSGLYERAKHHYEEMLNATIINQNSLIMDSLTSKDLTNDKSIILTVVGISKIMIKITYIVEKFLYPPVEGQISEYEDYREKVLYQLNKITSAFMEPQQNDSRGRPSYKNEILQEAKRRWQENKASNDWSRECLHLQSFINQEARQMYTIESIKNIYTKNKYKAFRDQHINDSKKEV